MHEVDAFVESDDAEANPAFADLTDRIAAAFSDGEYEDLETDKTDE
jgi:hypothetical protein